jgi:hypothetical protein
MNKFDHIVHILFLLAIIAFSTNYYFQTSKLPLPAEQEVVKAVFWLLLIFVIVELSRLIFSLPSKEAKIQNDNVQRSQLRLAAKLVQLLTNRSLILLLITLAYPPSILALGTFTASFSYMVVLGYALGSRRIKELIVTNVIMLALCYLLFVTLLGIHFPKGILF